jgi:hypothetical protein
MTYDYQIVKSTLAQIDTLGEQSLRQHGMAGFKVMNTWTEQDQHGHTLFIFLMEREIPHV